MPLGSAGGRLRGTASFSSPMDLDMLGARFAFQCRVGALEDLVARRRAGARSDTTALRRLSAMLAGRDVTNNLIMSVLGVFQGHSGSGSSTSTDCSSSSGVDNRTAPLSAG